MTQTQALDILKTGANVFLTGEPGSGKTHTVNAYTAYLRERGIEAAITASTGIAATHIGGMTIHSWSGIGIRSHLTKYDLDAITSNEYIVKRVRRTNVLIIDEVSMLAPETLAMVEAVCREIKQCPEPFGGLQVVLVGDFFQLPPIVKIETDVNTPLTGLDVPMANFAYQSAVWEQANPLVCYLTEQYRQDDNNFLGVLAAIRGQTFNDSHRHHLVLRKITASQAPDGVPKLYSHNVDVDRVNSELLAKLPGQARIFNMESSGAGKLVAALKKGCLSPETLILKTGAAIMFTKNNQKEGFVNGTLGVVTGFSNTSGNPVIKIRNGRRIEVELMEWTIEENGRARARIIQLPLRLAWAITVHKSQGMSLDEAVMDLTDVFEFGQGYVALSRVRRLTGLHLLGWNERAFEVHPDIVVQDETFRAASDDAVAAFTKITPTELLEMRNNFIRACGGTTTVSVDRTLSRAAKVKVDTMAETMRLLAEGKSLAETAEARGLKRGTIVSHVEQIKHKTPSFDLSFLQSELPAHADEIRTALLASRTPEGEYPLGPAKAKLGETFSYEELRLVRLLLS
jgi:hypothetical protein